MQAYCVVQYWKSNFNSFVKISYQVMRITYHDPVLQRSPPPCINRDISHRTSSYPIPMSTFAEVSWFIDIVVIEVAEFNIWIVTLWTWKDFFRSSHYFLFSCTIRVLLVILRLSCLCSSNLPNKSYPVAKMNLAIQITSKNSVNWIPTNIFHININKNYIFKILSVLRIISTTSWCEKKLINLFTQKGWI